MQKKAVEKRRRGQDKAQSGSSGDEREDEDETVKVTSGRKATTSAWAFSHWTPTPANRQGSAVWVWHCNWCS